MRYTAGAERCAGTVFAQVACSGTELNGTASCLGGRPLRPARRRVAERNERSLRCTVRAGAAARREHPRERAGEAHEGAASHPIHWKQDAISCPQRRRSNRPARSGDEPGCGRRDYPAHAGMNPEPDGDRRRRGESHPARAGMNQLEPQRRDPLAEPPRARGNEPRPAWNQGLQFLG